MVDDNHLGSLTSRGLAATGRPLLLLPLGATEQHGPHLPLDTDSRIAVAWAEAVAGRHPNAVVAPVLAYGSSGEHQEFAGTLSIGADAVRLVIVELIRSASSSFEAIVVLCGHAGNLDPVVSAVDQMRTEGHSSLALFPSWDRTEFPRLDAHAGWAETSIMLWLDADRVDGELVEAGTTTPLSELMPALRRDGISGVAENGVLGDPRGATSADGQLLLTDLTDRALASIQLLTAC